MTKEARAKKPKKLKITMTAVIEGEQGMADFARMLRVLYDNGYHGTVHRMVRMLVTAAEKHGAAVPPDLKDFLKEATDA